VLRALTLSLLVAAATGVPGTDANGPPNIVLLLADDAGYADFGFQKRPDRDLAGRTPHIDSIASAGARFTAAYMASSACSPSRAGLMTGRTPSRFGHENNLPVGSLEGLPLSETTLGERLQALGYRTGLVGKWHLGQTTSYHPNQRGFDRFEGYLAGSRRYLPYPRARRELAIQVDGRPTAEAGHVTDRLGDAAVRFIAEHRQQHAEVPFFLFVSFSAPHGPLQPREEDLVGLDGIDSKRRRKYVALVRGLDASVGRILAALDEHDLADRTLVVFTNDNGGPESTGARHQPLRGGKSDLLEGGIRVPLAMRWPGRIEPDRVVRDPVSALDLLPTFVALAGGSVEAEWELDGVDLAPLLQGDLEALPPRALFWRLGGPRGEIAVRRGPDKLRFADRRKGAAPTLHDVARDPGETRDRAAEEPGLVAELSGLVEAWEREQMEPRWRFERAEGTPRRSW
jgi:arylsulfatase A-like enzyme